MFYQLILFFLLIHSFNGFADSFSEAQKIIDEQWMENRQLLDSMEVFQYSPQLYLYNHIVKSKIDENKRMEIQLMQRIDFNENLQHHLFNSGNQSQLLEQLECQHQQLQIALAFQSAFVCRLQHNFEKALKLIEKGIHLALHQQNDRQKGFKTTQNYLSLAYYQQGKLHRSLAGYDLAHLDEAQLQLCEEKYLEALKLDPENASIYSSLGFETACRNLYISDTIYTNE
jgi:hypothetical protein